MNLKEITQALQLSVKTGEDLLDRDVTGGYASDMLSDVLAHARKGNIWITLQTHANIVAVASTRELAGIIIVNGRTPEAETLRKADLEKIPIMSSSLSTYSIVARLSELGIKGDERV
ncbi:MAG TPA: serine kinase [Bacteroidetes bacterium]|nr:serine kinase [Bacteroidota bacterium]